MGELSPELRQEIALARAERKSAPPFNYEPFHPNTKYRHLRPQTEIEILKRHDEGLIPSEIARSLSLSKIFISTLRIRECIRHYSGFKGLLRRRRLRLQLLPAQTSEAPAGEAGSND